jgi:non-ribosomal peptide synthetase component E (peptide arylation enzyme)
MEAIRSSESHIPEDCILHSHRRENLKSYIETSSLFPVDSHHTRFQPQALAKKKKITRAILRTVPLNEHKHNHRIIQDNVECSGSFFSFLAYFPYFEESQL